MGFGKSRLLEGENIIHFMQVFMQTDLEDKFRNISGKYVIVNIWDDILTFPH